MKKIAIVVLAILISANSYGMRITDKIEDLPTDKRERMEERKKDRMCRNNIKNTEIDSITTVEELRGVVKDLLGILNIKYK